MAALGTEDGLWLLADFAPAQRARLLAAMTPRELARGDCLYRAGEAADALYLVNHGRVALGQAIAHSGEMAGETAFFAGLAHEHEATALRDSEILVLERAAYEQQAAQDPSLAAAFLRRATRRLHRQARPDAQPERAATIAIVPLSGDIPPAFFDRLAAILERRGAVALTHGAAAERFGKFSGHDAGIVAWLNSLECSGRVVTLFADTGLTDWTERCLRQADQVVFVGSGAAPGRGLSDVERHAAALLPAEARRLVLLHPRRVGVVSGTGAWLDRLAVAMHHHVALEDDIDLESLARFLTGTAIGFVAGGGGGLGSAHVGVYKAFREAGVTFDIFVGTSVGAAMTAGFAFLYEAEGLEAGTHDIFVASRAFKRPTWPRYGLLDHKNFDRALQRAYGAQTMIEDCWRPFRAVATNLTARRLDLLGRGLLWKAVRASSAIPCVLPPMITPDGTVYIDGGVMDDAPLAPMQGLKAGPNVVVHFGKLGEQRVFCDYDAIPGRGRLLASLLNPFARLPRAPRPLGMLFRTMLAHQRYQLPAGPLDLVLTPPSPRGASVMNFDNHVAVSAAAYRWARKRIADPGSAEAAALAHILPRAEAGEKDLPVMQVA